MQILSLLQLLPHWKLKNYQPKLKSILLVVSKYIKLLDPASNGIGERLSFSGGLDFVCFPKQIPGYFPRNIHIRHER